ncbi:MAG: hypothetical protein QOH48_1120 [Actinomycetota bacterium]|nr:hypothetical protein [Actinomycetota bacterium]
MRTAGAVARSHRGLLGDLAGLPATRLWGPPVVAVGAAMLVGPLVTGVSTTLVLLGAAAFGLVMSVCFYPPLAAFLLLALTPLLAGIDRGSIVPVLRPSEAVDLILGAGLIGAVIIGTAPRQALSEGARRISRSILIMAVVSSVVPLLWMVARGVSITQDDVLYALMIWKYYGIYLLIRTSVRSETDVRRCLWISMLVAAVVSVIAIFQALGLFGVANVLGTYYNNFGNTGALVLGRGSSTLALPIAVADLMIFNLAVAAGFLMRPSKHRKLLFALVSLFVAGTLAAGEFSGVLGLAVAVLTIALLMGRFAPILALTPVGFISATFLRSVIETRLAGFKSASGLPTSWVGRLDNLRTYFWPSLSSHYNFILGLRPTARVAVPSQITGYVWIESGYTWLLWAGGIPFLLSFFYFVWAGIRAMAENARKRADAVGAAATGALVGLVVVGLLMVLDPHLTYRGSGDFLFSLLALGAWTEVRRPRGTDRVVDSEPAGSPASQV